MADIINQIDGQVQIIFSKGEGILSLTDAIWMTQAEYDNSTNEAIEAIKDARYNGWMAMVASGESPQEPPQETLIVDE